MHQNGCFLRAHHTYSSSKNLLQVHVSATEMFNTLPHWPTRCINNDVHLQQKGLYSVGESSVEEHTSLYNFNSYILEVSDAQHESVVLVINEPSSTHNKQLA